MKKILQKNNKKLRLVSEDIDLDNIPKKEIYDLQDTCKKTPHCAGLASPQIGHNIRAIAIKTDKRIEIMINPVILNFSENTDVEYEECKSIKNTAGEVKRSMSIQIRYYDQEGQVHQRIATGFNARVIQHEVDHLDGILFTDKMV